MTIFKYQFSTNDGFTIQMPAGATVLTVQLQQGIPCIWAKLDPQQPNVARHFRVFGTGHNFVEGAESLRYVGTYQEYGGSLIWHLFECLVG